MSLQKLAVHNISSLYRSTLHPEIYLWSIDLGLETWFLSQGKLRDRSA
ncbi:hypothetical protein QUB08_15905 [Microcoleus sp. BR0-C5]